jgi:hypothetical protein
MSFSSASRHSARRHRDRGPAPPRVFALTAPPSAVETGRLPTLPLPARRFSQPLSGSDDGTDLRVYSTPQALQGFRPSEPDSEAIGGRLRPRAPSPLPALHVFLPHHERHLLLSPPRRYYPNRDSPRGKAPRLLAETGFRLGLGPTVELCARSGAPRSLAGFTRPEASATLLAFPPPGFSSPAALSLSQHRAPRDRSRWRLAVFLLGLPVSRTGRPLCGS